MNTTPVHTTAWAPTGRDQLGPVEQPPAVILQAQRQPTWKRAGFPDPLFPATMYVPLA